MPQSDIEKRKEYNKLYYQKNKCEHGKQKSACKICGGSQICEHDRNKYKCKDCKGIQYCQHERIKYKCKDCRGSQICEHNKNKHLCKLCIGNQICEHNKIKCECKMCGGSQICQHNKVKSKCKECNLKSCLINLQCRNINKCLKKSNLEKTKPTIEYLGCNALYFKNYIESKMTDEMTFDNIHIDHIKPINAFNLNDYDEFLKCCHYSNFQPLLAKDNLLKGSKWNEENEKFWIENICEKEYKNGHKY